MTALLVPMHVMAVLVLGLLIGQQRWSPAVIVVYAAAMLVGLGAIALAYVPRLAEEGLLVASALAGLALALGRPLPDSIGAALAAAIGLSLALDSPPEALSLHEANRALAATAAGAIFAVWAIAQLSARLRQHWQRIGARIAGSWIAASAILVLALRLVR
jgi:urease accessory protein